MKLKLDHITLIVRDQQEALSFYTEKLGFDKRSDNPMGPSARWITVAAPGDDVEIVFQSPEWFEGEERANKAAQVGQNPAVVFGVDDCQAVYEAWSGKGVQFASKPENTGWGVQAVALDLYGNSLVLVQR
ncbi:MAG TPA: VOC family protein [Chloroflexia bacterium]|nr:VOC family protein [Chloroflexia bacterium]